MRQDKVFQPAEVVSQKVIGRFGALAHLKHPQAVDLDQS
jgi:hypothetical protein